MPQRNSFRHDNRGVAALEFAVVAPVLVLLLVGMAEITTRFRVQMKVNHTAGLLAKMVAQQAPSVTGSSTGSLANLCTGAKLAMTPFPSTSFAGAIASVTTTASGSGTHTSLDWESDTSCATTATAIGSAAATGIATSSGLVPDAGDSLIIVRVSYVYTPTMRLILPASTTLTQTIYVRPRANTTITCSKCS